MPDSSLASTAATDAPDYDFPDLVYDDGSTPENTAFDDLDYDAISTDEGIAFAAGDYTPNGWLENKNLRILPLGGMITVLTLMRYPNHHRFYHIRLPKFRWKWLSK